MTSPATAASQDDAGALKARIAALEAENERLASLAETTPIEPLAGAEPVRRKRNGWRAFVSALCIVIASILVPVAVVGAWARVELVDPDQFVATFGPLVDDPEVQAMVIDQVTTAVNEQVDIATITNDLFDGIAQLDLPPRALAAIDLLRTPAIQGVEGLIDQTVTRVVESDQFEDIWDAALRASHRGLVAAATGGQSGGAVVITDEGVVGIQLGPIVAEVKQRLVDRGVTFASAIPEVNRTIVVAQSDSLATIRVVYSLAVTLGWWLPVIMLIFFIAGIAFARRKTTAVLGSAIGLALGGLTLVIALAAGVTAVGITATNAGLPSGALIDIYEQVVGAMRQTAIVLTVLGIVIAAFAWTQGRWAGSVATRRAVAGLNDSIRGAVFSRGVNTGRFGLWMDRQRVLVRIVIAVLAIIWLWLLRPLGVGEIFTVVIVALLVWWVCELVRRPSAEIIVVDTAPVDAAAVAAEASVDAQELERVGQAPPGGGPLDVVDEGQSRRV
jgi:hypothetical protein